jgi:rRNA-processing protein FCF1
MWVLNDLAILNKNEISWKTLEYQIEKPNKLPVIPIKELKIKCYIPNKEVVETGVTLEDVQGFLRSHLITYKPFVTNFDFLMPFTCPSIALKVIGPRQTSDSLFTMYGKVVQESDTIYRINEATNFAVEFFPFPRFNKNVPVILDTSAIDFSRLPLSTPFGSFSMAYLNQRVLVIPKTTMHEVKTRLGTPDSTKVQKALARLNNMRSWGLIKDIKIDGEFSIVSTAEKKDIENLRDCIILDTAKKLNGILFTNDCELIKLANTLGIYTITFSGLADDVLTVIKDNNLKLTSEQIVEKVKQYGQEERAEDYSETDVKWIIADLSKQKRITTQKIGGKEVLEYLAHR